MIEYYLPYQLENGLETAAAATLFRPVDDLGASEYPLVEARPAQPGVAKAAGVFTGNVWQLVPKPPYGGGDCGDQRIMALRQYRAVFDQAESLAR